MSGIRFFLFAILMAAYSSTLFAETLILKSGEVVTGKITGQDRASVRMDVDGRLMVFQKTEIQRIVFSRSEEEVAAQEARRLEELRRLQEEQRRQKELRDKSDRENHTGVGVSGSFSSIWRSALFPGWGQFHDSRDRAGYGWGGSFLLTGIFAVALARRAASAEDSYRSAIRSSVLLSPGAIVLSTNTGMDPSFSAGHFLLTSNQSSSARTRWRADSRAASAMAGIAGLIYAANIIDVVLFHPGGGSSAHAGARMDSFVFALNFDF